MPHQPITLSLHSTHKTQPTNLVKAPQPLIAVCLPEHITHATVLDRPTTNTLGLQLRNKPTKNTGIGAQGVGTSTAYVDVVAANGNTSCLRLVQPDKRTSGECKCASLGHTLSHSSQRHTVSLPHSFSGTSPHPLPLSPSPV